MDSPIGQQSLVLRHFDGVRRYLAFLGCPADHLADLVQDTFVAAFTANLADDAHSAGWLRTTARHRLLKLWRNQQRRVVDLDVEDAAWQLFSREDDGAAWLEALSACIDELPNRSQQAVWLQYRDALGITAIAPRLGLAASGVESL
ncbi:MAG: sigma-70 family RNA polymerase sigma factor, partial [Planctomycetes bacterium]|nr:sigma-70 family RNA polymerase sigma factor [Planctomycetota bacterium]